MYRYLVGIKCDFVSINVTLFNGPGNCQRADYHRSSDILIVKHRSAAHETDWVRFHSVFPFVNENQIKNQRHSDSFISLYRLQPLRSTFCKYIFELSSSRKLKSNTGFTFVRFSFIYIPYRCKRDAGRGIRACDSGHPARVVSSIPLPLLSL